MNGRFTTVLLTILPLALAGCDSEGEAAAPVKPRPVMSVVAASRPVHDLRLAGVVEARIQADLGFRVLGRIMRRDVNVGDSVTKGQVIASIDPLALELAVKSGEADLSSAEAQLVNASVIEQRQRKLAAINSASQAALESAEQANASATAEVAKARANLDKARDQLGYAWLEAEFDGVVTGTSVEVGQVVSAGQTAITIARPDLRDVVVDVPEDEISGLTKGLPFTVMLQLDPSIRTTGMVREIAPESDATTRTRRVKITLDSPPEAFRLGSVVSVVPATQGAPVISLPEAAILREGAKASVWIVDPDKKTVAKRSVTIEAGNGASIAILSGLKEGDRVAVAGVNRLAEGQQVRIEQERNQ
ncbi:efflux RND transporter periplasmic adaptor subunit [Sinorhizobium sp. BG8]|uniref:efflux RND transporter periplasmic adaptor subunit n=1 Tax=Sinorhizobium sp. BG8 TaxID=2613773 RepID=UPI00193E1C57|nr:efflux RND transporter periplasmic adaptor subunit [Sinorhizobium sp. BG8]QRM57489.1 efflux RND transporter periplasmic adaptor subunit [Sinorhizobium sp. BG8]